MQHPFTVAAGTAVSIVTVLLAVPPTDRLSIMEGARDFPVL